MTGPFRTAPMKDGIRYDSRGEPIPTTRDTPEAVSVEALRREIGRQLTDARVEELMRAEAIPLHGRGISVDLQARGVAAALRALVAYDIVSAALAPEPPAMTTESVPTCPYCGGLATESTVRRREAEAVAARNAEIAEAVRGLPNPYDEGSEHTSEAMLAIGFEKGRAAVLALVEHP